MRRKRLEMLRRKQVEAAFELFHHWAVISLSLVSVVTLLAGNWN